MDVRSRNLGVTNFTGGLVLAFQNSSLALAGFAGMGSQPCRRRNHGVHLVVVAIVVVLALGGLLAYCQFAYGGWPALDMPNFQTGGTWKFYCRT